MRIGRRSLLGLAAASLAWPALPRRLLAGGLRPIYLGARSTPAGEYRLSAFTADGEKALDLPLPARGHSFALHPRAALAVHFARRPGRFAKVVDLAAAKVLHDFAPPGDRHFYGHGVFEPGGRLLYATENDFDGERGVVGIYDAFDGYRRVGEFPSAGIGPHEIRMLSDGVTLAVANGGILTHPDLPRVKLNLPSMSPSLAYVDRRDGRLLEDIRLADDLHQLGIRHLAVGRDDTVAVAMQFEGPAGKLVPLVATHRRGEKPRLLEAPDAVLQGMKQYCGSVAFDRDRQVFAVSAPRGNLVTTWDADAGRLLASAPLPDGCGVAPGPSPGKFLATSGRGGAVVIDAATGNVRAFAGTFAAAGHWDNHLATARA